MEYIHELYRKFHIKEYEFIEENSETKLDLDEECEKLKRYFITLGIFYKRNMKKKVCEFTYPCTTSMFLYELKYKSIWELRKVKGGK